MQSLRSHLPNEKVETKVNVHPGLEGLNSVRFGKEEAKKRVPVPRRHGDKDK